MRKFVRWLPILLCIICATGGYAVQAEPQSPRLADLLAQLKSQESSRIRRAAYELCKYYRRDAYPALPDLTAALEHREFEIRRVAAYAIGCIGRDAVSAAEAVGRRLAEDVNPAVREAAAEALSHLTPAPDAAILALVKALNDDTVAVQRSAAFSLEALGNFPQSAAPPLTRLLAHKDPEVRRVAAYALAQLGPGASSAVQALIRCLRTDENDDVRDVSAYALSRIGHAARPAVPALELALGHPSPKVQRTSADALQRIAGLSAVPVFIRALRHSDPDVRRTAANALGQTNLGGRIATAELIKSLRDSDAQVQIAAADAIGNIAAALQDSTEWTAIPLLRDAAEAIQAARLATPGRIPDESVRRVTTAMDTLEAERRKALLFRFGSFLENPKIAAAFGVAGFYLLLFLFTRFVVLRFWPGRLLKWNDALNDVSSFQLPSQLGEVPIPIRYVLLIGFYRYHDRVLDNWIETHIDRSLAYLESRETFKTRRTYVPLPVRLNNETISDLKAELIRSICRRERWSIHIQGEGGLGKTTLARQIALWSSDREPKTRLIESRRMIPILLEPSVAVDYQKDVTAFERAIRGQLQNAVGAANPIAPDLLERLLRTQRLLVIQDGLSETAGPGGPEEHRANFDNPLFPVSSLVVTTRTAPPSQYQPSAIIQPLRIDTNHLLPFMNAYLLEAGITLTDPDLFDACRRLSEIVGTDRGITPLLASLYAKGIVEASKRNQATDLPGTIPDLMLDYVSNLNRNRAAGNPDNPTLHRIVKIVAWRALLPNFTIKTVRKADVEASLGEAGLDKAHLKYVETQLNIIRTVGADELDFQFLIEPIGDYLGALYAVDVCSADSNSWKELIGMMDSVPGAPTAIREFLIALRDSCAARADKVKIPASVIPALETRLASSGTSISREPPAHEATAAGQSSPV